MIKKARYGKDDGVVEGEKGQGSEKKDPGGSDVCYVRVCLAGKHLKG